MFISSLTPEDEWQARGSRATHPAGRASGAFVILYAIGGESVSSYAPESCARVGLETPYAIIAVCVLERRRSLVAVWSARARCDSMLVCLRMNRPLRLFPLFLAVFGLPAALHAGPLEMAASQLAAAVVLQFPSGQGVALEVRNISSLDATEVAAVRRALETELQNRSVLFLAKGLAPINLRVTLSENLEGYLWVAEIRRGDTSEVILLSVPRPGEGLPPVSAPAMEIRKQLFWQQADPILDWAMPGSAAGSPTPLLVLESTRLALYQRTSDRWVAGPSFAIPRFQAWAREDRGWLSVVGDAVTVSLPGTTCRGTWQGAASLTCQQTAQPWMPTPVPLQFGGADRGLPPAFSYAVLSQKGKSLLLAAGFDGLARLYEEGSDATASFPAWGSDLVGVSSSCGSGSQVLVTGAGDYTQPDTIRAFEIHERQAVPVSAPVNFSGPVTALWPASDGTGAVAVVRNLETALYEAYRFTVSCGP